MVCCEKPKDSKDFDRDDMSPLSDRKCKDVLFLLAFIAAATCSALLTYEANQRADLNVLKYGIDATNELCGVGHNENFTQIMYCLNVSSGFDAASGGDPTSAIPTSAADAAELIFGVCVNSCPRDSADLVDAYTMKRKEFEMATNYPTWMWELNDHFAVKTFCIAPTISVLNRCIYDFSVINVTEIGLSYESEGDDQSGDKLAEASQLLMNAFGDLQETRNIILLGGLAGGMLVSFLWLQFMKFSASKLVWGTILAAYSLFLAATIVLAYYAGLISSDVAARASDAAGEGEMEIPEVDAKNMEMYKNVFYVFCGIDFVLLCILIYLRNRINLAIALVKEAADCIRNIPQLLLQPIAPVIFIVIFVAYFIAGATLLVASGELVEGSLQFDEDLRRAMFYHVFFCMWCLFLVLGTHSIIMGGTVATYYWTRDKSKIFFPITKTILRTIRFNLGSACAGSLILTIVKLVKWYLMYLAKQFEKSNPNNKLIKYAVACFFYLLECIEDFIQFITKNAYILIACDGNNFCYSTGQAFKIVLSNAAKMATVNLVTTFLFTIARLGTAVLTAIAVGFYIQEELVKKKGTVSSPFAPMFVVFVLATLVSKVVFEVASFTVDTLLVCFCLDQKKNKASGNFYASKRLVKYMKGGKKKKKKKGEEEEEAEDAGEEEEDQDGDAEE